MGKIKDIDARAAIIIVLSTINSINVSNVKSVYNVAISNIEVDRVMKEAIDLYKKEHGLMIDGILVADMKDSEVPIVTAIGQYIRVKNETGKFDIILRTAIVEICKYTDFMQAGIIARRNWIAWLSVIEDESEPYDLLGRDSFIKAIKGSFYFNTNKGRDMIAEALKELLAGI